MSEAGAIIRVTTRPHAVIKAATGEPAVVRWLLIGLCIVFLSLFLLPIT